MRHRVLAAVLAVSLFPLPALAHTDTELAEWQTRWIERAHDGMTSQLLEEWQDMRERHPCQLAQVCRRATVRPLRVSASPSGVYRGMGSNVEQWRPLTAQYWPASLVDHALCIIQHESGGNPSAKNPNSSASGLMQHLARYWPERSSAAGWGGSSIWNPEANIAVGAWLYTQGGWGHWTANRHC